MRDGTFGRSSSPSAHIGARGEPLGAARNAQARRSRHGESRRIFEGDCVSQRRKVSQNPKYMPEPLGASGRWRHNHDESRRQSFQSRLKTV